MVTRQTLKDDLLLALATGQNLRSTALAQHLYPLIDALALMSEVASAGGFHFVNGVPAPSLGEDGNAALNYAAGVFYEKVSGAWVARYTDQVGTGGGVTVAQVNALINGAGHASQADLTALAARVTALENPPPVHTNTRYCALRPSGAMPGDYTEGDFLDPGATSSTGQDITLPASSVDAVPGLAVPVSEGPLTAVAGLAGDGTVNQFELMIRDTFFPRVGQPEVVLNVDGEDHYVYCRDGTVRAIFLGITGYRLNQTPP